MGSVALLADLHVGGRVLVVLHVGGADEGVDEQRAGCVVDLGGRGISKKKIAKTESLL